MGILAALKERHAPQISDGSYKLLFPSPELVRKMKICPPIY